MDREKKIDSKEVGLEIGLILGEFFFNTAHLHYGYWTEPLKVALSNLPQAQENYNRFLISHIPKGIKTVLEVGCGTGRFAKKLLDLGYQVDGVSPSPVLTAQARKILGQSFQMFECYFEALKTEARYDIIIFSESFQYVEMDKALQNSFNLLNDSGYVLICDFFKKETEGKSIIGGGKRLSTFYDLISKYAFIPVKDIDITKETAPTIDMANQILMEVGSPVWHLVIRYLNSRYFLLSKFLQWKYQKKIQKINRKYFSGMRNADHFSDFKTYRLFLYQKSI